MARRCGRPTRDGGQCTKKVGAAGRCGADHATHGPAVATASVHNAAVTTDPFATSATSALTLAALEDLTRRWAGRGVRIDMLHRDGEPTAVLSKIAVDDTHRGQGLADAAMTDLTGWADSHGVTLALTASGDFGASPVRLRSWYARHGFVPNRGKDHRVAESMVRPHPDERAAPPSVRPPTAEESEAALLAELDAKVADGRMSAAEADEIRAMLR